MRKQESGTPDFSLTHCSLAHELLRRLVGFWPFERGAVRIPLELARLFRRHNSTGILGSVGAGSVLFPYQPGDVANPAYWYLYEREVRDAMRQILQPGFVFVDVGAHRGFHAAYALALVGQHGMVIACEPFPPHADRLRMVADFNAADNFKVHQVAVVDSDGEGTLLAHEHEGWHTLVPRFTELTGGPRRPIATRTISLDSLLSQHPEICLDQSPPRIVIKVDAEGAEFEILNGAENVLASPAVRAWIIEITGGGFFGERALACVRLLREAGWNRLEVLKHGGLRKWQEADAKTQINLLATRNTASLTSPAADRM